MALSHLECGGSYYNDSGSLQSPGYPNNYTSNLQCYYHIYLYSVGQVTLDFHDFDVEGHEQCTSDYVKVSVFVPVY